LVSAAAQVESDEAALDSQESVGVVVADGPPALVSETWQGPSVEMSVPPSIPPELQHGDTINNGERKYRIAVQLKGIKVVEQSGRGQSIRQYMLRFLAPGLKSVSQVFVFGSRAERAQMRQSLEQTITTLVEEHKRLNQRKHKIDADIHSRELAKSKVVAVLSELYPNQQLSQVDTDAVLTTLDKQIEWLNQQINSKQSFLPFLFDSLVCFN
jgi:hypothetical protein